VGGGAGGVLVDESGRAGLLVLGGLGGHKFAEWLPNSVLAHVVARAHCPVVITGPSAAPPGGHDPVRVAVDGTVASLNALRFGCEWALRHAVPVEATHVVAPHDFDEAPGEFGLNTPAKARLDGWVKAVQREYPAISIEAVLVEHAEAPESLVTASHAAAVLAVGAARPHAVPRLAAGSVVPDLIHRAACPVAVVRAWRL
jgi:nucleotide-binding universal stress UspA family protein